MKTKKKCLKQKKKYDSSVLLNVGHIAMNTGAETLQMGTDTRKTET